MCLDLRKADLMIRQKFEEICLNYKYINTEKVRKMDESIKRYTQHMRQEKN